MPMDEIDKKILSELQSNARLTNQELADRAALFSLPLFTPSSSIRETRDHPYYHASVDPLACGLPVKCVLKLVKLEKPTEENTRDFEQHIEAIDEVLECFLMTGNHDYLLHVVSESLKSYEQFIRKQLTRLPNIASIESSFCLGQVNTKTKLPVR